MRYGRRSGVRTRLRFAGAALLLTVLVLVIGSVGSVASSLPAAAQSSLRDRYAVVVAGGEPGQARSLGFDWFLWPGSTSWALTPESRRPAIPTGLKFPIILYMAQPQPDNVLISLARAHPGTYWYLGNEPNIAAQDRVTPEQYAAQLNRHATIIKSEDPTAKLIGPNVLNWTFTCDGCEGEFPSGRDWIDQMRTAYRNRFGGEPPLDIWALHAYDLDWTKLPQGDAERQIAQIQGMRDWLNSIPALADKPMWLTEVGLHWGYPGLAHTSDGLAMPVGEFDYAHVERYMRAVFGWLNQNAERLNIQRWFLWASWFGGEPWQTQWTGISLMDGPGADAPINRLGRLYRELAGIP